MPQARHLVTVLAKLAHRAERNRRRHREEVRREVEMVDEDKWRWEER